MPYATRDELFTLALGAAAFVVYARPFDAVNAATATIRIKGHGFTGDDIITFEKSDGGYLPTGVSEFVTYTPVPISADLFQVALDGTTVTSWASAGKGWGITLDTYRRIDLHLNEASGYVDEHLTAHEPPIQPDPLTGLYPWQLVGITARIAARRAIASMEVDNQQFRVAIDRLVAMEADDRALLEAWKGGKPINPRPTDEDSTAENSARARSSRTAMPWTTGTL